MSVSSSRNGGTKYYERGRSESPFGVVASTQFESGPPVSKFQPSEEDGEVIETVKEEEWEERRKKTTTTTRNVERRVQRQLVLEDGEVIEDTGPVITEDATEDSVTKEVVSDQNKRPVGQLAIEPPEEEGWIATPGAIIISEKCTKTTKSHEEVEDEIETEEVQHCGDVTNKEAEEHIKGQSDLRELIAHRQSQGWALAKPQKRVVHESTRRRGNIDTENIRESSKIKDGHVVTETERNVTQEQYDNESAPDSGSSLSDGSVHEATKETSHNLVHTKDEDLLEYYAVPKGATLAQGVKIGEGMHVVSEDVHEDRQGDDNDEAAAERLKKIRRPGRRDALTKKPLDYDQEEETRKTETNKWLEHHFGSESGRSEDSFQEDSHDKLNSSGGNRITITMSPYPASNEDVPDHSSPSTRWTKDSIKLNSSSKGPPPPPPPKPERIWSPKAESPTSPTWKTFPKQVHEIHDSELAAARSRLRSTGLNLTEENKENNAPDLSRDASHELKKDSTKESAKYSSPSQKKFSTLKEDVIYSSKFRSGNPKKNYAPLAPGTASSTILRAESPPPTTTVGRSQSFNVQTLPWSAFKKESSSKYKSSIKDYRSEERLDDIDSRKPYHDYSSYTNQTNHWNSDRTSKYKSKFITEDKAWNTKPSWSPPREPTPPPPPRPSRRSPVNKSRNTVDFGKEAATQTGSTPIPPPRTKRKKKPKNSYFFGQDSDSSLYTTYSTMPNGFSNRHSTHEPLYSNSFKNEGKYYTEHSLSSSRRSPKLEKRYKTTKTITPVLVIPHEERSERYRNMDYSSENLNKSSWTNTVDPRRRPRMSTEEERSTTLPRKHLSSSSMSHPKKTYIFGESGDTDRSNYSNRYSNSYIGSVNNVSTNHLNSETDYSRFSSLNTRLNNKSSKPVGRSQSFNVQAGKSYTQPTLNGRTFSEIKDQKTSTAYGSTPYVNLRSPNLIASIARTSSTSHGSNFYENEKAGIETEQGSEKKDKFMKGLLNNAPELYQFIHGDEDEDVRPIKGTSKPSVDVSQHYSQPSSKSPSYSARVFTFGKSDSNTLTRTPQEASNEEENIRNSYTTSSYSTEENNKRNSVLNNPNRRSTFNLKASGSSLLYSPSFRNPQQDVDEKRNSSGSSVGKERYSGDFSSAKLPSGVQNENPAFIQVRDWNMR